MGIKNLKKWLRDKFPEVITQVSLYEFQNKKISVDISSFIYKYKLVYDTEWLKPFMIFLHLFKKCRIHAIFIFDGQAPPEKEKEQLKRREQRDKSMNNILKIQSDLELYKKSNILSPELSEFWNKLSLSEGENIHRLLHSKNNKTTPKIDTDLIKQNIDKKIIQSNGISKQDTVDVKELLSILGIPFVQAPGEAEALACYLYKQNQVVGTLSEDTDVLVYGSKFICDIDTTKKTCNIIDLEKILNSTQFTYQNFVDFCIMCKCDYNDNIHGLGTAKLYNLFKNHITIEEIMKCNSQHNYEVLNLNRCRELFSTFGNLNKELVLPVDYWNSNIDFDVLYQWLDNKNINLNKEILFKNWNGTEIIFV